MNALPQNRRKDLGLRPDSLVIGNFLPLTRKEDQASLLKAQRKLRAREIDTEVLFWQDGPLRKDLCSMAQRYHIADSVHFGPHEGNADIFFSVCDVVVFCGFDHPNIDALIQAMRSAKPVVATKIPGYRDLIEDGRTGFLVPCGFPERIEGVIKRLEANPDLRTRVGQAAGAAALRK